MGTATCTCTRRAGDAGRVWVRECPEHGEAMIRAQLLPVGSPIRSVRHPELTGHIEGLEWTSPGELSPIPYLIGWDDSAAAHRALGMMFVYACVEDVERVQSEVAR
jgi:hypothetical protein